MDRHINPRHLIKPMLGVYNRDAQGGRGIFSIFSKILPTIKSLVSRILPIAKNVAKSPAVKKAANHLKEHAIEAGLNVASDAIEGSNIGESIKKQAGIAGKNLANSLIESARNARGKKRGASFKTGKEEGGGGEEEEEESGGEARKKRTKKQINNKLFKQAASSGSRSLKRKQKKNKSLFG